MKFVLFEGSLFDTFLLYQFIKKLATPFDKTDAFKLGLIDKDGKVLKHSWQLKTQAEKEAFTQVDVLIWNLKKLINKLPGGKTQLASYAAAAYLMRESKQPTFAEDENMVYESFMDYFEALSTSALQELAEQVEKDKEELLVDDAGAPPANNVGSGNIAGTGDGVQYGEKKKKPKKGFQELQKILTRHD